MTALHCLLLFLFSSYYNFGSAVLILILGLIIVFKPDNIYVLLKSILIAHIVAFALGGLTMALGYYIDFSNLIGNLKFGFKNFSFKILLTSVCVSFVFIKFIAEYLRKNIISRHIFCDIKICFLDKQISFNALVDTGNFLRDQKNKLPIIIAEFDVIKNIFSDEINMAILKKDFEYLCQSKIKFSFTPFKSVGNKNGILICFKPDVIQIFLDNKQNQKKDCEAVIGICDFKISDDYHGLISPELI